MEGLQDRATDGTEDVRPVRLVGAEGGVMSGGDETVIVVDRDTEPAVPVQVRV